MTDAGSALDRATDAYAAMQRRFWRRGRYRRRGGRHLPGAPEHLWPVARALVATLDLIGAGGEAELDAPLTALDGYWAPPAYASDPVGSRFGGDVYYDDNAWVGLGLVQLERLRPGTAPGLGRAAELYAFAVAGWAPEGGVYWVQQGTGIGLRNHDRNTVSNAPNAQVGLHLAQLGLEADVAAAERMVAWVDEHLRTPEGLYWDKIRGDGSLDRALWSYNQGNMIGAHVLLHRHGPADHLPRAEATARAALRLYGGRLHEQPPAFNAIFLRNLLQLHAATADEALREQIITTHVAYADRLWAARSRRGTLLDESAAVQVLALAAWDPVDYPRLA